MAPVAHCRRPCCRHVPIHMPNLWMPDFSMARGVDSNLSAQPPACRIPVTGGLPASCWSTLTSSSMPLAPRSWLLWCAHSSLQSQLQGLSQSLPHQLQHQGLQTAPSCPLLVLLLQPPRRTAVLPLLPDGRLLQTRRSAVPPLWGCGVLQPLGLCTELPLRLPASPSSRHSPLLSQAGRRLATGQCLCQDGSLGQQRPWGGCWTMELATCPRVRHLPACQLANRPRQGVPSSPMQRQQPSRPPHRPIRSLHSQMPSRVW